MKFFYANIFVILAEAVIQSGLRARQWRPVSDGIWTSDQWANILTSELPLLSCP